MSSYYPQACMTLRIIWEDFRRGSARTSEVSVLTLTPENLTVSINDYRTADTFSADIDYRNFPFDPRAIRSIGVTVHIQDVRTLALRGDRIEPSRANTIFLGFVDESSIDLDEDSRLVRLKGRDYTALFLDTRWDGTLVDLENTPVDRVIQKIVGKLESTKDIIVENRTGGILPVLSGLIGQQIKAKRSSSTNENYWDVIQDLVGRAGLIAYMEIDTLVISKPQALYEKKDAKQFVYGKNIKTLEMERKIGRMKDTNLRLLSLNPRASPPVLEAYIPKDSSDSFRRRLNLPSEHLMIEKVKPDGTKDKPEMAPVITFSVPHAKDRTRLISIGEDIFEEMSRQQIEGKLTTHELCARDQAGVEFDMTKLRIGTPIEVRIDNEDLTGIREVDSEEDRYSYLVGRRYNPTVARALAKAFTGFGAPFYTRAIEFRIDAEAGFSVSIQFLNFIELRESLVR